VLFYKKIFKNREAMGAFRFQPPLAFDVNDLKLRNLAKLWFFKLIMTKFNYKKSVVMSVQ